MRETFATSPFAPAHPRWCERYHHGHYVPDSRQVRFTRSETSASECVVGANDATGLSCSERGCDPCDCCRGSPCSKVGDPLGNAVIQTTADYSGPRRIVRAEFRIEHPLPVGKSHLALYAALHPHCHTTAQAILVPDGSGMFHLNVAAFNQFIGGVPELYPECARDTLATISPVLVPAIALEQGREYRWALAARLDSGGNLVMATKVTTRDGRVLASARHTLVGAGIAHWFGLPGKAARFGFGAQFSRQPSPAGGDPALILLAIRGDAGG